MITQLIDSIKAVLSYLGLIALIVLFDIFFIVSREFSLLIPIFLLIPSTAIYMIIYARVSESAQGANTANLRTLFTQHWWNYLLVIALIVFIPVIIFMLTTKFFGFPYKPSITYYFIFMNVLTVYVYPYVFLNNQNTSAISDGVRFLFRNASISMLVIVLSISSILIKYIKYDFIWLTLPKNLLVGVIIELAVMTISVLLRFSAFYLAIQTLLVSGEKRSPEDSADKHSEANPQELIMPPYSARKLCSLCGFNMREDYYPKSDGVCLECRKRIADEQKSF